MKKFFESLREHSMKEINFKKNKNEVINEEVAGIIKKKNANISYIWKIMK